MSLIKNKKIKPITAYAVVKNNKINVFDIYSKTDTDIKLFEGEKLIEVIIKPNEKKES